MMILFATLACSTPDPAPAPTPEAAQAPAGDGAPSPEAAPAPTGEGSAVAVDTLPDGDTVPLTGTVDGFGDGQVRFVEMAGETKVIHVAAVIAGSFSIQAPAGNANPVYIGVTGADGSWAALTEPVSVGSTAVDVAFASTDQPDWAANMTPKMSETVDPASLTEGRPPPEPAP